MCVKKTVPQSKYAAVLQSTVCKNYIRAFISFIAGAYTRVRVHGLPGKLSSVLKQQNPTLILEERKLLEGCR